MTSRVASSLGSTLHGGSVDTLVANSLTSPPGKNTIDIKGGFSQSPTRAFTPVTGATVTITDNSSLVLINPAGALANLTINMPANPTDGQLIRVIVTQGITNMTHSGNGNTITQPFGSPTTANSVGQWTFLTATSTWYGGILS